MTDNKNGRAGSQVPGVETAAGFTAGVVSTLVFHPLDVIKTRLQVNIHDTAGPKGSRPLTTMAVVRAFMGARNPVAAAYRGLPVNLAANSAGWACFFQFKDLFERAIARPGGVGSRLGLASGDRPSGAGYFAASGLAGVATSCITNPLWLLRTRIISTDGRAAAAYPTMRAAAARVYRGEGLAGFYKGLGTSLIGTSHGAIQFALYEPLRNAYLTWTAARDADEAQGLQPAPPPPTKMSNEATLAISTASKTAAVVATFPHQVVRNRLQNQRDATVYGAGISGVATRMWREGGIRPFYRGIVPGLLRTLPATWVTFIVIEYVRFYLPRWLEDRGGHSGGSVP